MFIFLSAIKNSETRTKLEMLYMKYYKEMYYISMNILNNTYDAQDAVQTSILKLTKYIERIEDVNSNITKNLIVTIVRNTAIDVYRNKQLHPYTQLEDIEDHTADEMQSLDELVIRIGDDKWLAEKLSELKSEYAEVLTFRYYYGFSDIEIADLLSISYENVRTRLSRAKAALKKLLEEDQQKNIDGRRSKYGL